MAVPHTRASQMKVVLVAVLWLCASASVADQREQEQKNRPVSKVVTLLKDMVNQLEKEADTDEEVYETMGCWCETNDKEKTKSIGDAEQRIAALSSEIEELTGESSRLNTEIKNLDKEVAKNTAALDAATALRQKQLAEFNEEEKDMLQSIASLGSAVVVLGKHNSASALLQRSSQEQMDFLETITGLSAVLRKHSSLLAEVITPQQKKTVEAFVQAPGSYFDSEPTMKGVSYAPQSGEIFGIIGQMKETFETNLAASQKDEMDNQKAYEDLKAAKTDEITAGQTSVDTKTVELGNVDQKKANSEEDQVDTSDTLAADQKFLANLKEKCATMDSEYEARTTTRQQEIQAVSKAMEFLSSDEAKDLFTRTFSPALVQVQAESKRRAAVVTLLQDLSKKFHDPRLATLAVRTRLDAFTKVKETLGGMIEKLLKEKEDDIKHKDFCVDSFNQNERATAETNRFKEDAEAKINDLQMTIDNLTKAIDMLKAEVAELQVQMKRAGEDREKANKDFQLTVADQRASQKLLTAALDVLKGFYEKGALLQKQGQAASQLRGKQAPPPGFQSYEKQGSSGGVMGLIQQIIDDAKAMEAEAIAAEGEEQTTYEAFVADTNAAIDEKTKSLINKSAIKGKTEQEKVEVEAKRDDLASEIEGLEQEEHDLHKSCDFLLKNFEPRVEARDEEVEALKQGIAMFSGASFGALLERQ